MCSDAPAPSYSESHRVLCEARALVLLHPMRDWIKYARQRMRLSEFSRDPNPTDIRRAYLDGVEKRRGKAARMELSEAARKVRDEMKQTMKDAA